LGYTERVSRDRVAGLIESQHPELHGVIAWVGSEQISIRGAGETLLLQPFIEQAQNTLLSEMRRQMSDVQQLEIQPVSAQPDIAVPRGKVTVVSRIAADMKPNKRLCAWLDISVDDKYYQTVPVWFSLRAYRQVLVVRHPLTLHHLLREEDVVMESRDVAGISGALTDLSQLRDSFWLKRPLPEGAVVAIENIEKVPLVRSGQNVRVTLSMGPVHIETEGVAQVYGRMGDIVRVQNTVTSGNYAARVTGYGEVAVNVR
jgi:flagella basal body P-ring formation protein FlgA